MLMIFNTCNNKQISAHGLSGYGFNINAEFEPCYMNGVQEYDYLRDVKGDRHYTAVYQVLVKSKADSDLYGFSYKIVSSPYQERNWGFMGIGSYGNNYYNYDIKTKIDFSNDPYYSKENYTITDYAPVNLPDSTTGSIGVGYGKDGPSISASVDYSHSELDVYSYIRTGDRKYSTYYKIRGTGAYPSGEVNSYGMLMFRRNSIGAAWISVSHDIQYIQNVGWDKTTSAGKVDFDSKY